MRVKAIVNYNDFEINKAVRKGDEFEVSDARAKILITAKKAVEIVTNATVRGGKGSKKQEG